MSTVLDVIGTVIALAFILSFKEHHWHKVKDAHRNTSRQRHVGPRGSRRRRW